ncbi:MAG TPA: GFA family protein [Steroidobacteraceae bacterium]|nr:GFA family protein [Steroidobacteraceae bacterium]
MDLSTLLNTLVQGAETGAVLQIEPSASARQGTVPETAIPFSAANLPAAPPASSLAAMAAADVYHGSGAPASDSLLVQSGVSAYNRLLNVFATREADAKSAALLTNSLGNASAALKSAFYAALSRLPQQLQGKDWGFSIANGKLVFTANQDELSPQDLADLQKAFAGTNVESSARDVAAAMTSIELRRQAGSGADSLAWGRLEVDESNFSDVINLREYITSTAPGGNYNPGLTDATSQQPADSSRAPTPNEIPLLLGGMDLRHLVTANPDFFRDHGALKTDELDLLEGPQALEDTGTLHGQCSCGDIRFTVEDTFEYAFYCHCSRCRLRTGSVFAAIAGIPIDKVQVTAGRDALLLEGECSDGYGARCAHCHAFLFAAVRDRQYMHVSLGALMDAPTRLPDHHVYVGSKAPWYRITDGLPQYEELPY